LLKLIAHICFRLIYPGIQAELRICGGGQGKGAGTAQEGVGQRAGRREDQANKIPHPANGMFHDLWKLYTMGLSVNNFMAEIL